MRIPESVAGSNVLMVTFIGCSVGALTKLQTFGPVRICAGVCEVDG